MVFVDQTCVYVICFHIIYMYNAQLSTQLAYMACLFDIKFSEKLLPTR